MTLPQPQLVLDTIDCLVAIGDACLRPEDATQRLRLVGRPHPETRIDLLWEHSGPDDAWHYDALLHLPARGTLSLSYCRDDALPWPMRGARRWSDADLVRVNDTTLTVDRAIAKLDVLLDDTTVSDRLVDACLVQEELDRHPVEVSNDELQRAMDGFRRAHKLYSAEACASWMRRRGITHARLERLVEDHAAMTKLRERLTADRVNDFFERHRTRFDTARIAQIAHPDRASAQQTCADIESGSLDFLEAAEARFIRQTAQCTRVFPSTFSIVPRGDGTAALSQAVFTAAPGALVGPIDCDAGSLVVQVLSFTPARLDDSLADRIQRLLFEQWLDERRQSAHIEWFWRNEG